MSEEQESEELLPDTQDPVEREVSLSDDVTLTHETPSRLVGKQFDRLSCVA